MSGAQPAQTSLILNLSKSNSTSRDAAPVLRSKGGHGQIVGSAMQPYAREIDSITNFRFGERRPIPTYGWLSRRCGADSPGALTMSTTVSPAPLRLATWRPPWVLIAIGCAIALIAFGPRSAVGQFLAPLSLDRGWGR